MKESNKEGRERVRDRKERFRERKRLGFEGATLLTLKMEEETTSQGM